MQCYLCGEDSIRRNGKTKMCEKHFRFHQMRNCAKWFKKYVPTIFKLEELSQVYPVSIMLCPDCGCNMHWIDDNNRSSGIVLQHYKDGTINLICNSCNIKHGNMIGDSYREIKTGEKFCSSCLTVKPLNLFSKRKEKGKTYPVSKCKQCSHKACIVWKEKNPERYRLSYEKNNALRKEKQIDAKLLPAI